MDIAIMQGLKATTKQAIPIHSHGLHAAFHRNLLLGIVLGLCVPQLLILATTTHKLVMGTVLHDLPVVEHSNLIAEPA